MKKTETNDKEIKTKKKSHERMNTLLNKKKKNKNKKQTHNQCK